MNEERRPRKSIPPTSATGAYARAFGWFGDRKKRRQQVEDREQQLEDEARELHEKWVRMQAELDRLKPKPEADRPDQPT